jgi:hypothetical protein
MNGFYINPSPIFNMNLLRCFLFAEKVRRAGRLARAWCRSGLLVLAKRSSGGMLSGEDRVLAGGQAELAAEESAHETPEPFVVFLLHVDEFNAAAVWRDVAHHRRRMDAAQARADLHANRVAHPQAAV